jgi:predicted secreted protein
MTTEAMIGHGSDFQRSSDGTSGGAFATVGEVLDITPPSLAKDAVDATHMASPDRWREFIAGLKDGGEVSLELSFIPGNASTTAALSDINSNSAGYYKIVFPDATEWGFAAIATGFEAGDPLDDKMTATLTYKLTGKPAFIV